jgi:hypothetical protein
MSETELRLIPDGRMRILGLLTENQIEAVRALKIEGLIMLNRKAVEIVQPETWIEYWFDKDKITEDDLRSRISEAINNYK